MIKQIPSNEIEDYTKNNTNLIQYANGSFNENFINDFKKLNIDKNCEILTMCMGGVRSQAAAEILIKENYICSNISDGFLGNNQNPGWKNSGLPSK